jgi:hypothetical protein
MRRSLIVLLAAGILATAVPSAHAKSTCSVPHEPAWHSCLTARHVALASGDVLLRRATPALVIRLGEACPAHLAKRKVVLRTGKGRKLASEKVAGHCQGGVARFRVNLRPNLELPHGTVVRTFWSGIEDDKVAPKVKL